MFHCSEQDLKTINNIKMSYHDKIPVWEVDITVIGPVSINNRINFNTRKELEHPDPFYSEINIDRAENGFKATITAFAPNPNLAEKAGILFFGRMLDVLSLQTNLPLQLDLTKNVLVPANNERVRRRLDRNDFPNAFREARLLSMTETTFLRALGWFRKGKYTQDPFDKFLAFWNSIETVASKYNPNKDNCKDKGSICHIWECFKTLWGDCDSWEIIGGQSDWIDICNKHRKDIAHGIIPIEINFVDTVLSKISELENVSAKFLIDWRNEQLKPEITPEIEQRLK